MPPWARGVLGPFAERCSSATFLPVYLRGEGDASAAAAFRLFGFFCVEGSFGVVCIPVTWVGESTVNSSSSFSSTAPGSTYSSWSVGVSKLVDVVSVCVISSSFAFSSYPERETLAEASKNCFQNLIASLAETQWPAGVSKTSLYL